MIGNSQKNYLWKTGADSQTDQTNEQRKQGSICLPMPMPANLTSKSAISIYFQILRWRWVIIGHPWKGNHWMCLTEKHPSSSIYHSTSFHITNPLATMICSTPQKDVETYFRDGIDDVFPVISRFPEMGGCYGSWNSTSSLDSPTGSPVDLSG